MTKVNFKIIKRSKDNKKIILTTMSGEKMSGVKEKHYVYQKPRSVGNIFALINEENRRNAEVIQ